MQSTMSSAAQQKSNSNGPQNSPTNQNKPVIPRTPLSSKRIGQPTSFSSPTLIKQNETTIGIPAYEYITRRQKLFDKMVDNSVLIVVASPQLFMSPDIVMKYRQNPNFHYLTGFLEPNAVCVLRKISKDEQSYILFVTELKQKQLTYSGYIAGVQACQEFFNPDHTYNIEDLKKHLQPILRSKSCQTLYCDFGDLDSSDLPTEAANVPPIDHLLIKEIYNLLPKATRRKGLKIEECDKLIQELRVIKSESEIELMKQSSCVAALSMCEVMESVCHNTLEDRLASIFEFGCRMRGATRLSAPVTISHGNDNNILHYLSNDQTVKNGNLCLLDSGAELYGYCSDITRVFPVNGKFSESQLNVYNAVLNVQSKCINECCKPGYTITKLDEKSIEFLIDELKLLGIDYNLLEKENHINNIEMWHSGGVHYVSHWIGMNIHDTAAINHDTPFVKGMCIALEPGIYLPNHESIPEKYRNIGIRIEDTLLITENGCKVLTDAAPKDPQLIEKLMKKRTDSSIWRNAQSGRMKIHTDDNNNIDSKIERPTSPLETVKRTLFHIGSNMTFM